MARRCASSPTWAPKVAAAARSDTCICTGSVAVLLRAAAAAFGAHVGLDAHLLAILELAHGLVPAGDDRVTTEEADHDLEVLVAGDADVDRAELRLAVAQHEDALLVFLLRLERGRGGARLGRHAGRELGSLSSEIKAIVAMRKYFPDDGLPLPHRKGRQESRGDRQLLGGPVLS